MNVRLLVVATSRPPPPPQQGAAGPSSLGNKPEPITRTVGLTRTIKKRGETRSEKGAGGEPRQVSSVMARAALITCVKVWEGQQQGVCGRCCEGG